VEETGRQASSTPVEKVPLYRLEPPINKPDLAVWQAQLEQVVQKTDQLSWLKIVWEPGDPWSPKQRWMLWQMRPVSNAQGVLNVPEEILAALKGPHPRSSGHACFPGYCYCDIKANRWVGGPSTMCPGVDRMTWELFQETQCYGERWWVIQGSNGGHRYSLSDSELRFASLASGGQTAKIPKLAELPYAPFDNRVLAHIARYDKLANWQFNRDFGSRTGADVEADADAIKVQGAELLADHLKNQVDIWLREDAKPWLDFARDNFVNPTKDVRPLDEETIRSAFVGAMSK